MSRGKKKRAVVRLREIRKNYLDASRSLSQLFNELESEGSNSKLDYNIVGGLINCICILRGMSTILGGHSFTLLQLGTATYGSSWAEKVQARSAHLGYTDLKCSCNEHKTNPEEIDLKLLPLEVQEVLRQTRDIVQATLQKK